MSATQGARHADGHASKQDELLCSPSDDTPLADNGTLERWTASYINKSESFIKHDRTFDRQYAQLYFARLMHLRPAAKEAMARKWPGLPVVDILHVKEDQECCVAGTLYKDQKLKPSILDEYTKDRPLQRALGAGANFCADGDSLVLEDEGARMLLGGTALPVDSLVTGAVIGVRGTAVPGGDFLVTDICIAGLPPQAPLPSAKGQVALVSGLHLGRPGTDMLRVQLLIEYLTGNLGGSAQHEAASQVVRLIIAGGCIGNLEDLGTGHAPTQAAALQPITELDATMTELGAALPLDLMPGPDDPANVSLPQQPLHRALFPGAAPYDSFNRCTNPHSCEIGGVALLGTSGQPINDMARYSRGRSRLQLLEQTLEWRHMAPTAPDTLASYPYAEDDPFILTECPHVYFAGGQPDYATKLLKGSEGQRVRLVCVPNFATSGMVVLLDLATLDCRPVVLDSGIAPR